MFMTVEQIIIINNVIINIYRVVIILCTKSNAASLFSPDLFDRCEIN